MKSNCFQRVPIVIAVVVGLSMAAAEFSPVRELLAALIIFSGRFGIIGLIFLTLFLIRDLPLKGVPHFESHCGLCSSPARHHMGLERTEWCIQESAMELIDARSISLSQIPARRRKILCEDGNPVLPTCSYSIEG